MYTLPAKVIAVSRGQGTLPKLGRPRRNRVLIVYQRTHIDFRCLLSIARERHSTINSLVGDSAFVLRCGKTRVVLTDLSDAAGRPNANEQW